MANDKTAMYVLGGAAIIAAAYFLTKKPSQPQVIILPGGGGNGTPGEGGGTIPSDGGTIGGYIQQGTQIIENLADAFGTIKDIFDWGEPDAGEILANEDFDQYGNPIEP
jgi:hypothetical protein